MSINFFDPDDTAKALPDKFENETFVKFQILYGIAWANHFEHKIVQKLEKSDFTYKKLDQNIAPYVVGNFKFNFGNQTEEIRLSMTGLTKVDQNSSELNEKFFSYQTLVLVSLFTSVFPNDRITKDLTRLKNVPIKKFLYHPEFVTEATTRVITTSPNPRSTITLKDILLSQSSATIDKTQIGTQLIQLAKKFSIDNETKDNAKTLFDIQKLIKNMSDNEAAIVKSTKAWDTLFVELNPFFMYCIARVKKHEPKNYDKLKRLFGNLVEEGVSVKTIASYGESKDTMTKLMIKAYYLYIGTMHNYIQESVLSKDVILSYDRIMEMDHLSLNVEFDVNQGREPFMKHITKILRFLAENQNPASKDTLDLKEYKETTIDLGRIVKTLQDRGFAKPITPLGVKLYNDGIFNSIFDVKSKTIKVFELVNDYLDVLEYARFLFYVELFLLFENIDIPNPEEWFKANEDTFNGMIVKGILEKVPYFTLSELAKNTEIPEELWEKLIIPYEEYLESQVEEIGSDEHETIRSELTTTELLTVIDDVSQKDDDTADLQTAFDDALTTYTDKSMFGQDEKFLFVDNAELVSVKLFELLEQYDVLPAGFDVDDFNQKYKLLIRLWYLVIAIPPNDPARARLRDFWPEYIVSSRWENFPSISKYAPIAFCKEENGNTHLVSSKLFSFLKMTTQKAEIGLSTKDSGRFITTVSKLIMVLMISLGYGKELEQEEFLKRLLTLDPKQMKAAVLAKTKEFTNIVLRNAMDDIKSEIEDETEQLQSFKTVIPEQGDGTVTTETLTFNDDSDDEGTLSEDQPTFVSPKRPIKQQSGFPRPSFNWNNAPAKLTVAIINNMNNSDLLNIRVTFNFSKPVLKKICARLGIESTGTTTELQKQIREHIDKNIDKRYDPKPEIDGIARSFMEDAQTKTGLPPDDSQIRVLREMQQRLINFAHKMEVLNLNITTDELRNDNDKSPVNYLLAYLGKKVGTTQIQDYQLKALRPAMIALEMVDPKGAVKSGKWSDAISIDRKDVDILIHNYERMAIVWANFYTLLIYVLRFDFKKNIPKAAVSTKFLQAYNNILSYAYIYDAPSFIDANIAKVKNILESIERNTRYNKNGAYNHSLIEKELFAPIKKYTKKHWETISKSVPWRNVFGNLGIENDSLIGVQPHWTRDVSTKYMHCLSLICDVLHSLDKQTLISDDMLIRCKAEWPIQKIKN